MAVCTGSSPKKTDRRRVCRAVGATGLLWTALACAGVDEAPADPAPAETPPSDEPPAKGPKTIKLETWRSVSDDPGCGDCYSLTDKHYKRREASTTLEPAKRYGVGNLVDEDLATAWCEGADGDGAGEWVSLRLEKPLPLDRITLNLGYLKSDAVLFDNARPANLKITTDTAQAFILELPEYPDDYVSGSGYVYPWMQLDGSPIGLIRVEIVEAYKGKSAADACISGIIVEALE